MLALDTETRRRQWRCRGCKALLGEVMNGSVIIAHGYRTWVAPITDEGVMARCKCGCENTLYREGIAA